MFEVLRNPTRFSDIQFLGWFEEHLAQKDAADEKVSVDRIRPVLEDEVNNPVWLSRLNILYIV